MSVSRPLSAVASGLAAGAAGMLAMDGYRYLRGLGRDPGSRRRGDEDFLAWETFAGVDTYEQAPDPARAFRRVAVRLTGTAPADAGARRAATVLHWAPGLVWGAMYAVLRDGPARGHRRLLAAALTPALWLNSYAMLGAAGVRPPIWRYSPAALAGDLAAHGVYGATTVALLGLSR